MQDTKIYVKKEGKVCTLYFDGTGGQPLPFSNFTDEPGLPQTMSYKELMARYGHLDIQFIERPAPPPKQHKPKSEAEMAEINKRIQAITGKPVKRKPAPAPTPVVDKPTTNDSLNGMTLRAGDIVEVEDISKAVVLPIPQAPEKVQNFLKMLQVANRYASAANRTILSIKIEAIEELMEEAWNVKRENPKENEEVKAQDSQIGLTKDQDRRDKVAAFQQVKDSTAEKIRYGASD